MLVRFGIMNRILRSTEGGGGGADTGGGGSQGGDPATDRNAKLESRLDELSTQIAGFIKKTQKQEEEGQVARSETIIRNAIAKGQKDLDDAEKVLAKAFDDGEGAAIAKAQREVALKAARFETINREAEIARREMKPERREGGTRAGGDLDTTNLDNWKSKHSSWYGVDKDMTKVAHEIDGQIREAGVIAPGTKEYFDAVDRQMTSRFPDRLGGSPQTGSNSGQQRSASSGGGQQRIAASVAEGYRRMGINVDDPKIAERMIKNRQKAVDKGFLPSQPNTGRVIER